MYTAVPPLGEDKQSRIIFVDLLPQIERLRDGGSAFVPTSLWIEKSYNGYFDDSLYVESVTFGRLSCPYMQDTFYSSFNDPAVNNKSRSGVTYYASENNTDCALPTEEQAVQFFNVNERCARSVLANETVSTGALTFEPLCLIVVIAPASRKELFDQLIQAKRPLGDPMRVGVNFVRGLNPNPAINAIDTNCLNSKNLYTNYLLDTTLQAERQELEDVRADLERLRKLETFYADVNSKQRFFQPPGLPPPPPPPPSPEYPTFSTDLSPPAPPVQVSFLERMAHFRRDILRKEAREAALVAIVGSCVSTRTHICGYSKTEAPSPWIGADGTPCRGNATKGTRFGDFCRYAHTWTHSQVFTMY